MDILIKGMEMPKQMESPITITIFKNGSVWMNDVTFGKGKLPNAKAVELPSHGRLGDLDLVEEWMRKKHKENGCPFDIDAFLFALRKIPTIVEASNADN